MKKRSKFKTISECEIIFWAISGLRDRLYQIAVCAADLREEGKREKAEDLRKQFNLWKDQYLELVRATYEKDLQELAMYSLCRTAKMGWGDEKK